MSGEENRAAGDAAGEAGEAAGESVESEEVSAAAEPVTLSYAAYEELKTLAKERDDYLKRLQRAVADYQNLQKRIDRFRESAREAALRSLAEEVLPMADSLSRALEAAREAEGAEKIVEGLLLVEKELYGALGRFGIHPVEALGQPFDPHYHEAAMQEEAEGMPANTVVRELKKGFVMGDIVIRPSQVVVAGGPSAPPEGRGPEGLPDGE